MKSVEAFLGTVLGGVVEAAFVGPEAQTGVGDIKDFFSVYRVPTVLEGFRVVFCCHLGEIAVLIVDAFDLPAGQVAGTVSDGETAFAGAVDEVCGGAEVAG